MPCSHPPFGAAPGSESEDKVCWRCGTTTSAAHGAKAKQHLQSYSSTSLKNRFSSNAFTMLDASIQLRRSTSTKTASTFKASDSSTSRSVLHPPRPIIRLCVRKVGASHVPSRRAITCQTVDRRKSCNAKQTTQYGNKSSVKEIRTSDHVAFCGQGTFRIVSNRFN